MLNSEFKLPACPLGQNRLPTTGPHCTGKVQIRGILCRLYRLHPSQFLEYGQLRNRSRSCSAYLVHLCRHLPDRCLGPRRPVGVRRVRNHPAPLQQPVGHVLPPAGGEPALGLKARRVVINNLALHLGCKLGVQTLQEFGLQCSKGFVSQVLCEFVLVSKSALSMVYKGQLV